MVGAEPSPAGGVGDPGRHRAAGLPRPRRLPRRQRPAAVRPQPDRLDLLHDRHPEHDRVRRHRADQRPGPAGERVHHHAPAHRVPRAADRYHPRGARLAGPRDVPGRPLEEEDGKARRRHRLRHQGPQRRRHPRQQRARSREHRGRRPAGRRQAGRARRRTGGRHRRRHQPQRAAPRPGGERRPGHHHHRPRRLQRAGHADRASAQPRRLHRLRGPRAGERAADAAVRRRLGDHLLRRGRPAARASPRSRRRWAR